MKMSMVKETIGPKKAMEYLKRNVANRPLSRKKWGQYAEAMAAGQWKLNGDCIRFNGNGDLIDGQHRLTACFESGITIETYVVRGLDHSAFDTIDQGKLRTISDIFARQGRSHYTTLAACVRWLHVYDNGNFVRNKPLRPDEANEIVERNPSIHDAVHAACSVKKEKLIAPGMLAFLILECGRKAADESLKFWTSVMTGDGCERGTSSRLLRSRLIQDLGSKAKLPAGEKLAIAMKAWNAHRAGTQIRCLKWASDESFPRIVH